MYREKVIFEKSEIRELQTACELNNIDRSIIKWLSEGTNLRFADDLRKSRQLETQALRQAVRVQETFSLKRLKLCKGLKHRLMKNGQFQIDPDFTADVDPRPRFCLLLAQADCSNLPKGDNQITEDMFPYHDEESGLREFALVQFSHPDHNGRVGPNESLVLDAFDTLRLRPATFLELISFGRFLRETYASRHKPEVIVALGSRVEAEKPAPKASWLRNLLKGNLLNLFREPPPLILNMYPCLECGARRGKDELDSTKLTACEFGPWPDEHLFLGVHV